MAIHLGRRLRDASSNLPGRLIRRYDWAACAVRAVPIRSCSRWGLPCRPCYQERGALLPHPFTLTRLRRRLRRAVCFLWHCPWGHPRRTLSGTVSPWSPDFPPRRYGTLAERPSGLL